MRGCRVGYLSFRGVPEGPKDWDLRSQSLNFSISQSTAIWAHTCHAHCQTAARPSDTMTSFPISDFANCSVRTGAVRYRLDIRGHPPECNWLDIVGMSVSTVWQGIRARRRPWLTAPSMVPLEPTMTPGAPPLLLMGVLSGSAARRELVRCTWGRVLATGVLHGAVRLHFVVGRNAVDWERADVLNVRVDEFLQGGKKNGQWIKNKGRTYSMYSTWIKFVWFLRYAAEQPERAVAFADDDVFVQPHMLVAHVELLSRQAAANPLDREWIAGAFEWYSLRSESLLASGWARDLQSALWKAQRPWRNCSPSGMGWAPGPSGGVGSEAPPESPAPADACHGPFGFIKGPLMLLATSVVQWVVRSPGFEADVTRASLLAEGRAQLPAGSRFERLPQDVILGYWLRSHPSLRYVRIPFFGTWCEEFRHVGELQRLLVAHRVPWDQYAWLIQHTEALWTRAHSFPSPHAHGRLRCTGAPCQPGLCSHLQTQRACAIEVTVPLDDQERPQGEVSLLPQRLGCTRCNCWELDGSKKRHAGGQCNFSRAATPWIPQYCWPAQAAA